MEDLFKNRVPTTPAEIIEDLPLKPAAPNSLLLAFSGGNDSRTLAHVMKPIFADSSYDLELAAIDTGLSMDGWKESIESFASWIGLPVSFWKGEGRDYYRGFVQKHGWPGPAVHSEIQNRLKGRAYRAMMMDRRVDTEVKSKEMGVAVVILSGVRKQESRKRQLLKSPYNYREGVQFANPLFYWSNAQVYDYMAEHDIPLAPGIQWDCKCGSTVKDASAEWIDMLRNAPELVGFLQSLEVPFSWEWGRFDKAAHFINSQIEAGQQWLDDGSIEAFPTCVSCWRDRDAEDARVMKEW